MLTAFAQPVAAAHSSSKVYDTSSVALSFTGDTANVGGVRFTPADHQGEAPSTIEISDASRGPVSWLACQDLDGDVNCGEDGEPVVSGCSTAGDLSGADWDVDADITVFISTADATCPGAVGTTGTVTLNYA